VREAVPRRDRAPCFYDPRKIPFDCAQGRLSLRLKSGSVQDDAYDLAWYALRRIAIQV